MFWKHFDTKTKHTFVVAVDHSYQDSEHHPNLKTMDYQQFNRPRYFCQVPCQFHFQNDYFLPRLSWAFIGPELGFIGTILMNLSKSYDRLSHDLLIAKFGGYGLGRSSLRLLMDHFNSFKL